MAEPPGENILVTGALGQIGTDLVEALRHRHGTDKVIASDVREVPDHPLLENGNFRLLSVLDGDAMDSVARDEEIGAIYHLAAILSATGERNPELCQRVNVGGTITVLETAKAHGLRVFAPSSIAVFGPDSPRTAPQVTPLNPPTTYGMTKAMCELLLNDHVRKGHFDGRTARLPTVIIRPGKPNAAASSWASGMFREPLKGEVCRLPVRRSQPHPMTGFNTVVESFIFLHELPEGKLGDDRGFCLPAHQVTPEKAELVLTEIASVHGLALGPIEDAFDAAPGLGQALLRPKKQRLKSAFR